MPSPADVQETFVFRRRDTACRVRSGNLTLPINFSYRGNKHFRRGRLPRRPIHKNCNAIFVWTRLAVSLRQGCYNTTAKLYVIKTITVQSTKRLYRFLLCLIIRYCPETGRLLYLRLRRPTPADKPFLFRGECSVHCQAFYQAILCKSALAK